MPQKNKRIVLLLLALVIISVSGCVISEENKTGWDWEKYEKYSEFYDKINNSVGNYGYKSGSVDEIEDFMIEIGGDTEFDKTWHLTFLYLKRGMEAEKMAGEQWLIIKANSGARREYELPSTNPVYVRAQIDLKSYQDQAKGYYNQSYNYRQKIEEWNPSKISPTLQAIPIASTTPIITSTSEHKTINNSIGMEFVLITAGEFDMGSPSNELGRTDESPVHHVKISKAFYMGKYEVTQKQWRDVMGSSPSYFKGDNLPVESVSWNEVQEFIKKLNQKEGSNKYRLPSEAEWEYAARAGTTTRYSFGEDASKLGDYAWYDANSGSKPHDVGQKKPNPWGLYDMYGNVWEWMHDIYHNNYSGAPIDGSSWESGVGSSRVVRGGYWRLIAKYCDSADRGPNDPSNRLGYLGFRLVRDV